MAYDSNHSDRVLLKFFIGISDGLDDLMLEVSHPTDIVDNGKVCDIVKKAINGDISAQGIFLRCSKAIGSNDLSLLGYRLFEFGVATECRDLDNLSSFKEDLNQPKSAADDTTVLKEQTDLVRMSVGRDIEISWGLAQEEITDTSSNEVGQKAVSMEAIKNF